MHTRLIASAFIALGLCVAVGCGDDGSGGSGGSGGSEDGGAGTGGDATGGEGTGGSADLLNGCDAATADDMTGMADVDLTWTLSHQECIKVDVGTTVTWTGTFTTHPLAGGETGTKDETSPISLADQTGASASVTFDEAGEYPYYCEVHLTSMQGVVYVE